MGDEFAKIRLGAVQAASVFLDRDATVERACELIGEAGANGADVIGFPEGFIPAHPTWYGFLPATCSDSQALARRLFQNAVEIPGPETERLAEACRRAGVMAVIGVCEKRPGTTGTLFNTQLFIGATGSILGKHQKLMPTVGERLVHTGGWGDTLKAYEAPFGMVSALVCGENSNPLAMYAMMTMNAVVHVAAWPPHFGPHSKMQNQIRAASSGLALALGCFVINSAGVASDAAIDACAANDEYRAFLEGCNDEGAASIVGPRGEIVAGPMGPGEGILYADVDLNDVLDAKAVHDFSGHYNRFDVFQVSVDRRARLPISFIDSPGDKPAGQATADHDPEAEPVAPVIG